MQTLFRLSLLPLLVLAIACQDGSSTPEKGYRLFVERVQTGDVDGAWELLTRESREDLTRLMRERSEASGGTIPSDPKRAIASDPMFTRPIQNIEQISRNGDRATLAVTSAGQVRRVHMVYEDGAWKVTLHLPAR